MPTPYVKELGLSTLSNEELNQIVLLFNRENGVDVPMDLTDCQFSAQARKSKSTTSALICDIVVTVDGDPTLGRLHLHVPEDVMITLIPVKGHYDVLIHTPNGVTDNLYQAPFIIGPGITDAPVWV